MVIVLVSQWCLFEVVVFFPKIWDVWLRSVCDLGRMAMCSSPVYHSLLAYLFSDIFLIKSVKSLLLDCTGTRKSTIWSFPERLKPATVFCFYTSEIHVKTQINICEWHQNIYLWSYIHHILCYLHHILSQILAAEIHGTEGFCVWTEWCCGGWRVTHPNPVTGFRFCLIIITTIIILIIIIINVRQ